MRMMYINPMLMTMYLELYPVWSNLLNSPLDYSACSLGAFKTTLNMSYSSRWPKVNVVSRSSVAILTISSIIKAENGGKIMMRGKWTNNCIPLSRLHTWDMAPVIRIVVIAVPTKAEVADFAVPLTLSTLPA